MEVTREAVEDQEEDDGLIWLDGLDNNAYSTVLAYLSLKRAEQPIENGLNWTGR